MGTVIITGGIDLSVMLHSSVYGRYLYAIGRNEEAALYSGINPKLVLTRSWALAEKLAKLGST